MRNARDTQPPHVSFLQNPVSATSAHSFLLGFASWDLDRRGAELEKAHLYPRFALSTRLEGSGRNGARGVKTAGRPARAARARARRAAPHHEHHECPGCNRFH